MSCAVCDENDPTICMSCSLGYGLFNNECVACHSACLTCMGPEVNQCLSCKNGFYLKGGCTCEPCYPTCKTCTGTAFYCTSCPVDMYLTVDYTCLCNISIYPSTIYYKDSYCYYWCPFGETYNNGYEDVPGVAPINGFCPDVNRYYGFWHPDAGGPHRRLHTYISGDAADYFD